MTAGELLERLSGAQRNGSGWMARCPAHEDKNPSLSVRDENGKVLLHCFAGCTVEAICTALGIRMRDLFTVPGKRPVPVPRVVRDVEHALSAMGLRSRLTSREREREVTVVLADRANPDPAIARALALAVEGELAQVAFEGDRQ